MPSEPRRSSDPGPARPDVTELIEQAEGVLRSAGASFALLHGSRAEDRGRPDSDIDIAAWWTADPPEPWELRLPRGVDLLVLNDAPLELAGRVAHKGRLLYETDPAERVRWQATTRKIWFDERPRFERAHREFLEAVRGR
jgi:predicted nucleotidyltransferase